MEQVNRSIYLKTDFIFVISTNDYPRKRDFIQIPDMMMLNRPPGGSIYAGMPHLQNYVPLREFKKIDSSCQALQYLCISFWDQVNIEVTRGHHRSKLPKFHIFSKECVIISETILVRRSEKKTFDSSWAVLYLSCHQISATINGLHARDKNVQNTCFWQKESFLLITLELSNIAI